MKSFRRLALAVTLAMCGVAHALPISYDVNRSVGAQGSIVGTITTDGTIGNLALANILEWDLTINADANSATVGNLFYNLGAHNSTITFMPATALSASSDSTGNYLMFDFGAPSMQIFQIADISYSAVWQMQGGIPFQDELVRESGPGFPVQAYELRGPIRQVVGVSRVPLIPVSSPSVISLMIAGLLILTASRRVGHAPRTHTQSTPI